MIICVGNAKTGTTSFRTALGLMGLKCAGFDRQNAAHYVDGLYARLGRIAHRFDAVKDWPWAVPEIVDVVLEEFPDARLVYTERDRQAWAKSYINHLRTRGGNDPVLRQFRMKAYGFDPRQHLDEPDLLIRRIYDEQERKIMEKFAGSDRLWRLNIFEHDDPWSVLEEVTGMKRPEGVPFPHSNRGSYMQG